MRGCFCWDSRSMVVQGRISFFGCKGTAVLERSPTQPRTSSLDVPVSSFGMSLRQIGMFGIDWVVMSEFKHISVVERIAYETGGHVREPSRFCKVRRLLFHCCPARRRMLFRPWPLECLQPYKMAYH